MKRAIAKELINIRTRCGKTLLNFGIVDSRNMLNRDGIEAHFLVCEKCGHDEHQHAIRREIIRVMSKA